MKPEDFEEELKHERAEHAKTKEKLKEVSSNLHYAYMQNSSKDEEIEALKTKIAEHRDAMAGVVMELYGKKK